MKSPVPFVSSLAASGEVGEGAPSTGAGSKTGSDAGVADKRGAGVADKRGAGVADKRGAEMADATTGVRGASSGVIAAVIGAGASGAGATGVGATVIGAA